MQVEFLSPLQVENTGRETWRLCSPLRIAVDTDELLTAGVPGALGQTLTVPTGFSTDFASVVRLPIAYLLCGGTANKAATVHDFLYSMKAPRKLADRVFLAAMEAECVAWWRRPLMYAAVRAFGWTRY